MPYKQKFYLDIQTFHQKVTGSSFLNKVQFPNGDDNKILIDCGQFQENEFVTYNKALDFNPSTLDYMLLTHPHIDHIGRAPMVFRNGYSGYAYCTHITKNLLKPLLKDTVHIDALSNKTSIMFTEEDISNMMQRTKSCDYDRPIRLNNHITATFYGNSHLLGASCISLDIEYPGYETISLFYTGDFKKHCSYFTPPPIPKEAFEKKCTIIMESTYGGTVGDSKINNCGIEEEIEKAIQEDKIVFLSTFAQGRPLDLLMRLKKLQQEKRLDKMVPIFLDGPLMMSILDVYRHNTQYFNMPFEELFPRNVHMVGAKARMGIINDNTKKIILSTSGGADYGPAQVYLPAFLPRENVLIVINGYTPPTSLGSKIINANPGELINIGGHQYIPKKARTFRNIADSSHAKQDELVAFAKQFTRPQAILLNHGEEQAKESLAKELEKQLKVKYVGILGRDTYVRISPYGYVKDVKKELQIFNSKLA